MPINKIADRVWSRLEIKSIDEEQRIIEGVATTPSTDLMDDVVDPMGGEYSVPMPFLMDHGASGSDDSVGHVIWAKPTAKGIPVRIKILKDPVLPQLDRAWAKIKLRLVNGLSIGFSPIEWEPIKGTFGVLYKRWRWLELSGVVVAANPDCSITSIKSIDQSRRAAAIGSARRDPIPGASGNKQQPASGGFFHSRSQQKGLDMKTIQELREERTTKAARCNELLDLRKAEDRKFNEEEADEFDGLTDEIKALDDDIRVMKFNQTNAAAAREVKGGNAEEGSRSRGAGAGGMSFVRKEDPEDKFKGQSYVRFLKLKALSRLSGEPIGLLVERHGFHKTHPKFAMFVKAAVAGGGTGSGEWGAELASLDGTYTGDFLEFLYGSTVFDRLPLKSVPARVRVKGQDGAFTAYWTDESKAIPVSAASYSEIDLTPLKITALAVISNELIEDSSPAADSLVMDGLSEAHRQKLDSTFLSAAAASTGVPAGILNGVTAMVPSGTDEAAIRADMQALAYPFVTGKMASGLVFVMNPAQGLSLGSFINTFSQPSFPDINENGGKFMGRTVFVGDSVTPGDIILLRPQDIWKIGDTGVQLSMSDTATIEMNDAPAGASDTPVAMASHAVSMFQTESTAFKLVRRINFQKRRPGAAQVISNAEYGGVTS